MFRRPHETWRCDKWPRISRISFGNEANFTTVIPRSIRLAEAPSYGKPILMYDPRSKGAESYIRLAKEILGNERSSREATQGAGVRDSRRLFRAGRPVRAALPQRWRRPVRRQRYLQSCRSKRSIQIRCSRVVVFQPERLEELAASIRANGIIQPLIVRRHETQFQSGEPAEPPVAGSKSWRA